MTLPIKICGITNLDDALLCCELGAWALGFNFYPYSPRYVAFHAAQKIIEALPKTVLTVGIFIQQGELVIRDMQNELPLSLVQIYGRFESRDYQDTIRVIQPKDRDIFNFIANTDVGKSPWWLVDAPPADQDLGGTGKLANWEVAAELARQHPVILAGGLTPQNVQAAIRAVKPFALDVCSGVESKYGRKDPDRLRQFFAQVKAYEPTT